MRKFVFYHMWINNDYIRIHNRIFSNIIANQFFDDCTFFFSFAEGNKNLEMDRLVLPKKYFISEYKNTGDESPAFLEMIKRNKEYKFTKDDIIGYMHCKGTSKTLDNIKEYQEEQNGLPVSLGIRTWTDQLSFFLIDRIEEYIDELKRYGSIGVFCPDYISPSGTKAGSLGNWWWATGDVISQCEKIEDKIKRKLNERKNI